MRAMTFSAPLLLLVSHSVLAACTGQEQLGQVDYATNSSYFAAGATAELDKISQQTQQKGQGYVVLEFNLHPVINDKKLQQYNLWLANRRLERVKQYLNKTKVAAPIVTLIKTAAPAEQRQVEILWCSLSSDIAMN